MKLPQILALVLYLLCYLPTVAAQNKPLRVGVVLALSGPAHIWGGNGRMALELAQDELNQSNLAGRPIQLVFEDSKTQPAAAVSSFHKLVNVDRVDAVVGDVWSMLANPLVPLSQQSKLVTISPTLMDSSAEGSSPYFFSLGHSVSKLQGAVEKFFTANPAVKSVAILCWDDAWGHAHVDLWKQVIAAKNLELLEVSCQGDFTHDYKAEISRLARKKPDALIVGHMVDVVAKRLAEQNFHPVILSTSNVVEHLVSGSLPPTLVEGFYYTDWAPGESFTTRFIKRFGKQPLVEAQNHYEALRALALAAANRKNDETLVTALRRVRFQGETDLIDFNQGPFANLGLPDLYRVQSGVVNKVQ